jgi:tRNA 2-thiouridine synthesizing protein A
VARAAAEWNAGELGCGELVLELRNRLTVMKPGERLELVALDPGAPADIPAWCRMTGHTLVSAQHPVYLIQRKED